VRITRIESQKRHPGRKNIYVDGAFLTGASVETLLRLGLRSGDDIGPEVVARLLHTESLLSARSGALRLLSVRPRTVKELRDRLRAKGYDPATVEAVVADLQRAALLDDEAFARAYIRDRTALKASGPTLLREKLLRLGVPAAIIEQAIAEELGTVDIDQLALRTVRAYLRKQPARATPQPDQGLRRRAAAHLARRGFSWETIARVLTQALSEDAGDRHE